jgi:hypothetical protein
MFASVSLVGLPPDMLHVIIQKTNLFGGHVLRFVCKNLHHHVHNISKSLLSQFDCPQNLHYLAIRCGDTEVFEWIISIFNLKKIKISF